MKRHADKHRKEITYEARDQEFLSSRNITTDRPSKKIEDKMLGPFPIVKKAGTSYELELPQTMKVHNVFHSNLLRKDPGDPLPGQIQELPGPIVTADGEEWDLADILNSCWHYGRLQYRCAWVDEKTRDLEWYYADGGEFDNSQDIIKDFHDRYPRKAGGKENLRAPTQKKKKRRTR
ncbi:Chromo domain-like [Lasallia pustulata]|uniref:Chromo domain-like n=1 Tax=Lasallia pustulata TaxID=136370 RepID=A0A1W5D9L5_9LECA|nr:Chromo domain-like [Lasallia pustulata]